MRVLISVFELDDRNLLSWMPNGRGHKGADPFLFSVSEFCFTCHLLTIITVILEAFVSFSSSPVWG